jgi:hypothetical protein
MTDNELSQRLNAAQKCLAARSYARCKECPDSGIAGVCPKSRLTPLGTDAAINSENQDQAVDAAPLNSGS